ncbi:MAG TPA: BamA/TamA family outer membrane protein [Bryobacteraceae bacterium]|nr:BamA/TamA family outer membrane protein [Bryobacteraceae bacterium]
MWRLPLVAVLLVWPLLAAPEDYEGRRIVAIRFDPAQTLVESDLNEALPIKTGQLLHAEDVRVALASLYATGRFEDLAADARLEGEGVVLTFIGKPSLFVRDVRVEGLIEPPTQTQALNAARLELGQPFTDAQVKQGVENVLGAVRRNGFYQARITTSLEPVGVAQQADITFHVDPGKRARYGTPIITGTPNRPTEQILKATKWKSWLGLGDWKAVTDTRTTQGIDKIRRMYQKRDYLMARVSLDLMEYKEEPNRVVPHISIESGPKVRVRTVGSKIRKGKLRQLVPVYQEQTVDRDLLVEGKRNITNYLEARGYFEAEVDFDTEQTAPDEQTITYSIAPGDRHKLTHLEITGNNYFTVDDLLERMYLRKATFLRFRHGRYSASYIRRDVNAIQDLYRANGFRDVEVNYRVEDDYNGENNLGVFLNVVEGPQWFVNKLEIAGAGESNLNYVQALLQSSEGQPFSDFNVATDQDTILSYYYNSGYPDARFDATSTPAAEPYRMNLKYVIHEGERQYVRDVLVSGFKATAPGLVWSRIHNLEKGDALSQATMTANQRRLYDLGIFARVDTAIQNLEGETDYKYVLYRLEEARRYSLTFGFGAEIARIGGGAERNLSAPGGAAGFSPRVSIGISRGNFFGQGHTISLQTRASNIQRRGLVTYLAPQFKGSENLSLTFSGLYDDSRNINTFSSRRQEATAQLQQRFSKANSAQYRIAWRRVTVDPASVKIRPELIDRLSQPVKLGIVGGTFIQDRRDDPSDARKGIYNTIDTALASNLFGSRTSFTRMIGRNATYHRIGREMVFARQLNVGVIKKLTERDVPLPERFFGGGATSHRGFGESQAGPRDPVTGFPTGGQALLTNIFELRFPLIGENVGGVLFHDAGNVYSSFGNVSLRATQKKQTTIDPISNAEYIPDFDYMIHAAGVGIRYRTPIGPVRVDLAYTFNPPVFYGFRGTREDLLFGGGVRERQRLSRFQFHFSLGQIF